MEAKRAAVELAKDKRAEQEAKEEAQQQALFYKAEAEMTKSERDALREQLKRTPEMQPVMVYQDTQETTAKMASLQAKIAELENAPQVSPQAQEAISLLEEEKAALLAKSRKLEEERASKEQELLLRTQERDVLAKEAQGYKKLAHDNLFATTPEKYASEIAEKNRQMSSLFEKGLRDAHALLPTPLDAQQGYGADEWARIDFMRTQAKRFLDELDGLKMAVARQFVDVSTSDVPRFFEAPLAFIESA